MDNLDGCFVFYSVQHSGILSVQLQEKDISLSFHHIIFIVSSVFAGLFVSGFYPVYAVLCSRWNLAWEHKSEIGPGNDREGEMIPGSGLFLLGISGFIILYVVLAHLSERMGEGLRLPGYYWLYYVAILVLVVAALYGWYQYSSEKGYDNILLILLIIGNVFAVAASYKYWWWLKYELWMKKETGEKSNE